MNTRTGLTGWLTPEGKFIKCKYGKHHEAAIKILANDQELNTKRLMNHQMFQETALREFLYVPMGSMGEHMDGASHISIPTIGNFTELQIKWLKKNYNKLDETQQEWLDSMGKIAGWFNPQLHVRRLNERMV